MPDLAELTWRRDGPDSAGWWVNLDENGNRDVNWYEGGERPGFTKKWWLKLPPLPEQHPDPELGDY